MAITMKDIIESNKVKDEAWNDYKESLKDKFTSDMRYFLMKRICMIFMFLHLIVGLYRMQMELLEFGIIIAKSVAMNCFSAKMMIMSVRRYNF